jgi:glycosyltransferase involved in cell wall biosynthesis
MHILFVGDVCKGKNVTTTIRMIKKLNEQGKNVIFDVVGDGEQMHACVNLSHKLQIRDKVIFHGWKTTKEELKKCYDNAHIFVMLSYRETFGTTYIEAISQGLPIIYTKDQGVDGYFEDGQVGYRCDPDDVDMARKKVISIINNYDKISQNCIRESKKFSWEIVAKKYAGAVENMLGSNFESSELNI